MPKVPNISIVFGRKLIKLMMAFPWRESSREKNCSEIDGGNKVRALITKPKNSKHLLVQHYLANIKNTFKIKIPHMGDKASLDQCG